MTEHRKRKFANDNTKHKPKRDTNSGYMAGFTKEELTQLSPEELDEVFDIYNDSKRPEPKGYSYKQMLKNLNIEPYDGEKN